MKLLIISAIFSLIISLISLSLSQILIIAGINWLRNASGILIYSLNIRFVN